MPKKRWVPCGYISKSRDASHATIMIADRETKEYYVADLEETLQALVGNLAYAKVLKKLY